MGQAKLERTFLRHSSWCFQGVLERACSKKQCSEHGLKIPSRLEVIDVCLQSQSLKDMLNHLALLDRMRRSLSDSAMEESAPININVARPPKIRAPPMARPDDRQRSAPPESDLPVVDASLKRKLKATHSQKAVSCYCCWVASLVALKTEVLLDHISDKTAESHAALPENAISS